MESTPTPLAPELPVASTPVIEPADTPHPPETSGGSQDKADSKPRPPSVRCAQHRLCCNFSHKSKRARQFEVGSSKARECESCHKWLCSDHCLQNHKACKGPFMEYAGASQDSDGCQGLFKAPENGAGPPMCAGQVSSLRFPGILDPNTTSALAKALDEQNTLARSQMELAQQALETQRRQHEQVMGALTRLEQHLTGYSPAMQAQQVMALQPLRDARDAMQADALMNDIRPGNLQAHVMQAGAAAQQPLAMHHL